MHSKNVFNWVPNTAYSAKAHRFNLVSYVYIYFHTVYSQYKQRFIPGDQQMDPTKLNFMGWKYFLHSF